VQYGSANIPQAWAAVSVFQLVQTILSLRADAPHGRRYVDPTLPRRVASGSQRGLKFGSSAVDIRFWREGDRSRRDVQALTGDIQVAEQRRAALEITESTQGNGTRPGVWNGMCIST
jgi:hypothetical protein